MHVRAPIAHHGVCSAIAAVVLSLPQDRASTTMIRAVKFRKIRRVLTNVFAHHDRCYDLLHELLVQGVVPENLVVLLACEIGHHSEADIRSSFVLQQVRNANGSNVSNDIICNLCPNLTDFS